MSYLESLSAEVFQGSPTGSLYYYNIKRNKFQVFNEKKFQKMQNFFFSTANARF